MAAFYLPTITTLSQGLDGSLSIRTAYYADLLPNVVGARIAAENGYQDGIYYQQGDLLFQLNNYPRDIDFTLDPKTGDLVVSGNDADRYTIVEAQLVYTDPVTMATKALGQVAVFHKGTTPPVNKELLWKDTTTTPATWKEWDEQQQLWSPTRGVVTITNVSGDGGTLPLVEVTASKPVRQWATNPAAATTSLSWKVTRPPGCPVIKTITVAGTEIAVTGETQSGTTSVTTPLNQDTTHTVAVTAGTVGVQASASATVKWLHKRLFFALTPGQDLVSISDTALSQLLNGLPAQNYDLGVGYNQANRIFTGTISAPVKIYEAFIDNSQQALFRVNGAQNNAWTPRSFTYTNSDGYAAVFRLYSYQKEVTGKLSVDTY